MREIEETINKYLVSKEDFSETSEALDILEQSGYTDAELAAYEQQLLNEITERSVRENLLEEGAQNERAKAHEEKLASALAIYQTGTMSLEQIASILKLDVVELEAFLKKY